MFECYCRTVYNTELVEFLLDQNTIICIEHNNQVHHANAGNICKNYERYDNCPGVNINQSSHLSPLKLLLFGLILSIIFI